LPSKEDRTTALGTYKKFGEIWNMVRLSYVSG